MIANAVIEGKQTFEALAEKELAEDEGAMEGIQEASFEPDEPEVDELELDLVEEEV